MKSETDISNMSTQACSHEDMKVVQSVNETQDLNLLNGIHRHIPNQLIQRSHGGTTSGLQTLHTNLCLSPRMHALVVPTK